MAISTSIIIALVFYYIGKSHRNSKRTKLDSSISRIFHYSFDEIGWDYNGLTLREKNAITEEEFNVIKHNYKKY